MYIVDNIIIYYYKVFLGVIMPLLLFFSEVGTTGIIVGTFIIKFTL